jgi:dipeptidyl-peptidase 4
MQALLRNFPAAYVVIAVSLAVPGGFWASAQSPAPLQPSAAYAHFLDTLREYAPKSPDESQWMDGGDRYTVFEPSASDKDSMDLVAFDTETGERKVLVPAKEFVPIGARKPLNVEEYSWSEDQQKLLIFTNSKRVWRENTRGDYWVLTLAGGRLQKLGGNAPASTLMFAKFSPDGRSVAYVRENNLYVEELASGKVRPLTTDGTANRIINGTTDWVNEEELFLRDAFRWSPDSRSIAYWQFDESGVQDYTLINDTEERYPTISVYKYPQAGTKNSAVRVGVVPTGGGPTRWIRLPGDARNHYIPRMDWVGTQDELAVEYLNRSQNDDQLYLANARTGAARLLFEDKDEAYVDILGSLTAMPHLRWLPATQGGKDLLWLSERDGWMHAYRVSHTDGTLHLMTHFDGDLITLVGADERNGWLYFTASPQDPIREYLYRCRLDGTDSVERVTAPEVSGTSSYDAAPNGRWAIRQRSSMAQPPIYSLVRLEGDKSLRVLEDNATLRQKVEPLLTPPAEFEETTVGGGIKLSTLLIKPPHFDPSRKYPVITYIYGEPAEATVQDVWGHSQMRFMAREGYLVLSFDNEGTPQPRGRAWRKAGYGAIGVLSSQQQAEAMRAFARTHAYVDTSRMAIWGWSGGGTNTLNLMFRYPGLYSTGVAVAPVPDQARYDSIYQERYMGLPAENAKGYHDGSAINFAEGLTGNLLLIHGSGDDNVHFQGAELLVNRLVELGKPFTFMDYPNRSHGLYEGPGTTKHLYMLIVRYIEEHVPPGPR